MKFISKLLSGGAAGLLDTVGGVVDKLSTSKEERMGLDLEMKKAEQQHTLEMSRLSLEEKKLWMEEKALVVQDVSSARENQRMVQTSKEASWLAKNITPMLALGTTLLTLGLFMCIIFDVFDAISDRKNSEIIFYVLGVLSAILTQVFGFYFGSSEGSKSKTESLNKTVIKSV